MGGPAWSAIAAGGGVLWAGAAAFWAAMLLYCILRDREERHIWIFVILFLNVVGALIYFLVRVIPLSGIGERLGARARLGREIARTEADIVHLGERPHLLARLGALHLEAGRPAQAEACLARAVEADGADPEYRYDLARARLAGGDIESAASLLAAIVAADRNHAYGDALRLLARALFELGRRAEARPLYEELVRTRPSAEARLRLALILDEAGDRAGALAQLERVRLEAPAQPHFVRRRDREWVRAAAALARRLS